MATEYLHDRGNGPELVGTRVTIYTLFVDFLNSTLTEAEICGFYNIPPQQVSAARAYILHHYDEVMAVHQRIEERIARGNPPEVVERAKKTAPAFEHLLQRLQEARAENGPNGKPLEAAALLSEWREMRDAALAEGK